MGALTTALVQQGLWMALSLGLFFVGGNALNADGLGSYSHMAWVLVLALIPFGIMKMLPNQIRDHEKLYEKDDDEILVEDEEEDIVTDDKNPLFFYQRMV